MGPTRDAALVGAAVPAFSLLRGHRNSFLRADAGLMGTVAERVGQLTQARRGGLTLAPPVVA